MTLPAHLPRFKLKDIQDKPLISSLKLEKRTGISYSVQKDTLSVPDFENCPTKLIHTDSPRSKDFFRSGGHVPDMSQELVLHNQLIRSSQVGLPKRDENPSDSLMLSFQISNFSDWKSIGEGSFGSVFKAFHGPTSTWMAIKEVKILDTEEPYLKNLQNEMDILFSCSNTVPQVVKYYGTFWLDNSIYICMEYMDLGSLTSWWFQTHNITYENRTEILDRTNFPGLKFESPLPPTYAFPEFVLKYISFYVATSLKFLNEKLGIIHKDIKPSNILFNSKAEVKLCDFGISSSLEEPDSQKGCPSYMPPELLISKEDLLKRRWIIIPHKIDVWSLGITLIELASGRYPFPISSHDSVLAQIYMIINGEPIISLSDEFSELFVDFVKKCLLKNPLERASMQELLNHGFLQEISSNELVRQWLVSF